MFGTGGTKIRVFASSKPKKSPDAALNLLPAMNRHHPAGPKHRRLSRHINKRAIHQGRKLQAVRLIEDDVVTPSLLCWLLFGPRDNVEPLLPFVSHDIVGRENYRWMAVTIFVVGAEKNNIPAPTLHSVSPNVL